MTRKVLITGTAGFMLLSTLIIAFVIYRRASCCQIIGFRDS